MPKEKPVWTIFANIFLGFWLLTSHASFGYQSFPMVLSDCVSGIIVIVCAFFSFSKKRIWAPWLICLVGIWLQFAPLVFWAPESASYLNDTIVSVLLIAFSILIPGVPGETVSYGSEIPSGWNYNPSSWVQRLPIIAFGCLGWFIARYLAAFELGYIDTVWDPFFGDGTYNVLTSSVSQAFPIPDAGLVALAYTLEALMGCKGDTKRWHSMPWIVIGFGILVVPLGLVGIILIILQPLIVGSWCTLCLVTATAMLVMIALTVDEVVAVLQHLHRVKKEGLPFWKIFWKGGGVKDVGEEYKTFDFARSLSKTFSSMVTGMTVPFHLLLCTLLGIGLMFAPSLFNLQTSLADSDHIMGALIITVSVVAMAEVMRIARLLLIFFGLWIVISPWVLSGPMFEMPWHHVIAGGLLLLFSIPKGKVLRRYGTWNRYIV